MICRSFEPVLDESARVLIVGSMPSVKSLEDAQYYAHPRNAFWPILFDIFGEAPSRDYERKKALIRAHHLALWDAAAVCEREGSLDSNMRGVVYNDFGRLYAKCPGVRAVLCNGAAAHKLFIQSGWAGARQVIRLPSTSPAYTMAYEKKREAWRAALCALQIVQSTEPKEERI